MSLTFREAKRGDVAAIVALLGDDVMGSAREGGDPAPYLAAFDRMQAEPDTQLLVGVDAAGTVVACAQLNFLSGLSLNGARRAQIEGVRVAADLRSQGAGALLLAECEARARAAGCSLVQLTSNSARSRAREFYLRNGYAASHTGFKKTL